MSQLHTRYVCPECNSNKINANGQRATCIDCGTDIFRLNGLKYRKHINSYAFREYSEEGFELSECLDNSRSKVMAHSEE